MPPRSPSGTAAADLQGGTNDSGLDGGCTRSGSEMLIFSSIATVRAAVRMHPPVRMRTG